MRRSEDCQLRTARKATTLTIPTMIVTASGRRKKAAIAVIAAAIDSAQPVVRITGAITAISTAGGSASSAASTSR